MEIRLLAGNELQWAVYTANEVFENCVRPYARTVEEVEQYYRYVQVEYLWQEMSAGRLFLWGAFEDGQMCAVSAMQNVGHITMLYVKPVYSGRRVGTMLLNHMCSFAASRLQRERVTVNVTPVSVVPYFYHMGFTPIQGLPLSAAYVSVERRIWLVPQGYPGGSVYGQGYVNPGYGMPVMQKPKQPEVTYEKKRVSVKRILFLVAGVLILSTGIIAGITIHHMAKDGLFAEFDYEREWGNYTEVDEELPEEFGEAEEI